MTARLQLCGFNQPQMLGDPLPQQLCLLCSPLDIGSLGLYICPRSGSLQSAGQTNTHQASILHGRSHLWRLRMTTSHSWKKKKKGGTPTHLLRSILSTDNWTISLWRLKRWRQCRQIKISPEVFTKANKRPFVRQGVFVQFICALWHTLSILTFVNFNRSRLLSKMEFYGGLKSFRLDSNIFINPLLPPHSTFPPVRTLPLLFPIGRKSPSRTSEIAPSNLPAERGGIFCERLCVCVCVDGGGEVVRCQSL